MKRDLLQDVDGFVRPPHAGPQFIFISGLSRRRLAAVWNVPVGILPPQELHVAQP